MVVISTYDPILFLDLPPGWHSGLLWSEMGVLHNKHFVYFCVCEILKVQSHFLLILTADPDGLMVEISTYDPHLISRSTPGWHSGLLLSKMGVNILYIFVYVKY